MVWAVVSFLECELHSVCHFVLGIRSEFAPPPVLSYVAKFALKCREIHSNDVIQQKTPGFVIVGDFCIVTEFLDHAQADCRTLYVGSVSCRIHIRPFGATIVMVIR